MRGPKINGYRGDFQSSFLSSEKDTEAIIKKLFVDSRPYSEELIKLLMINNKDVLDNKANPDYVKIGKTSVADLRKNGYIKLEPRAEWSEHSEVKNFLLITFDNFAPNATNPYYRDCTIMIDIMCHSDNWDIGNYRLRPLKIAGYIDGILNDCKLSGIGTLNFLGCSELVFDKDFSGYCLIYTATHGADDLELKCPEDYAETE